VGGRWVLRVWWWVPCCRPGARARNPSRGSLLRGAGNRAGDSGDWYQGGGSVGAVPARWEDRAVRWRWGGEDGADHGADQQHCEGARWFLGVRGSGRADPRGERSVQGDDREWCDQAGRQAGEALLQGLGEVVMVCFGWLRRGESDGVAGILWWQMESKCALVYGQMNEPPGARARVGLTGLTVAEYFRDAEGQDVLFFIDNIFRFTQVRMAGTGKLAA
jgi:hypothetical protein